MQNAAALAYMDALVGDKLAMFETAGALKSGRRVWIMARIPGELRPEPTDAIHPYVLLTNSHDGTSAIRMIPTTVRVVGQHTLNLALRMAGAAEGISIVVDRGRVRDAQELCLPSAASARMMAASSVSTAASGGCRHAPHDAHHKPTHLQDSTHMNCTTRRITRRTPTAVFCLGVMAAMVYGDDWPGWRGPDGSGHYQASNLPTRWNAASVVWRIALPGEGQSSPVIWGDRIFLTAALDKGHKRLVLCVDRTNGNILWQDEAWSGAPEKTHPMNGWASATCATDGERVVAFFGKGGLHCYSIDGKKLWSRDLGPFPGPWGTAGCPLIVGDLVIQNCDSTGDAFLVGVKKRTGTEVWRTPRPACPKGGWSSPILVDAGKRKEVVLNGETMVAAYDPESGRPLWTCKSFNGRGEPTAAPGKGVVYVVNGLAGDIYAVKLGGTGDVTRSHIAWHTPRKGNRDQPSPIVVGNYLLVADMNGVATCYDSTTGKVLWKERLAEGRYTASPIAAGGLVYFLNEAGVTSVIEPGPRFKLAAESALPAKKEIFRASLAPSHGQIFVRSQTHLYCIGK